MGKYINVEETKRVHEIGYQRFLDHNRYSGESVLSSEAPIFLQFWMAFPLNSCQLNPIQSTCPFQPDSLTATRSAVATPFSIKQYMEHLSEANPHKLYGPLIHPQLQPRQSDYSYPTIQMSASNGHPSGHGQSFQQIHPRAFAEVHASVDGVRLIRQPHHHYKKPISAIEKEKGLRVNQRVRETDVFKRWRGF